MLYHALRMLLSYKCYYLHIPKVSIFVCALCICVYLIGDIFLKHFHKLREEANINPAGRVQSERISVSPGKKYNIKRFQQLGLSATAKLKSAGRGGPKKRQLFPEI